MWIGIWSIFYLYLPIFLALSWYWVPPPPMFPSSLVNKTMTVNLARRKGVIFCLFQGNRDFLANLPSHATRTSRLPRLRPCSPEIRKKSRLFCRLPSTGSQALCTGPVFASQFRLVHWASSLHVTSHGELTKE